MRAIKDRLVLALDTETTGPEPETARIVELGAVYFRGGERLRALNIRINPGVPIPAGASGVHHIFDADVAEAPSFAQVAPRLLKHLSGEWARDNLGIEPVGDEDDPSAPERPLVIGYNILRYDAVVIDAELGRLDTREVLMPMLDADILDPIAWAQWENRGSGNKLTEVCTDLGVRLENAHAASADAEATGWAMYRLIELGIIPPDDVTALQEQAWRVLKVEAERAEFGHYFYRCRIDPSVLRVGYRAQDRGRVFRGEDVRDVPVSCWRYMLGKPDVHPGAAEVMRGLVAAAERPAEAPSGHDLLHAALVEATIHPGAFNDWARDVGRPTIAAMDNATAAHFAAWIRGEGAAVVRDWFMLKHAPAAAPVEEIVKLDW